MSQNSINRKINVQSGVLALIILLVAFSRLVPMPLNFSPLAAMALFGAAHFSSRWKAFVIPLIATWASDLVINNTVYSGYYSEFVWFYSGFYWQYGGYALIVLFGTLLYAKNISAVKVVGGALGSGLIFFIVSNFGVWASSALMIPALGASPLVSEFGAWAPAFTYTPDLSGLITCYAAAIPFYKGTLLGDMFYCVLLFGGYYLLQRRFASLGAQSLKHV